MFGCQPQPAADLKDQLSDVAGGEEDDHRQQDRRDEPSEDLRRPRPGREPADLLPGRTDAAEGVRHVLDPGEVRGVHPAVELLLEGVRPKVRAPEEGAFSW